METQVTPTLIPTVDGDLMLRVVGEGQLDRLEREFERHQGVDSRVLPARPQRYATPHEAKRTQDAIPSVFSDSWIVYQRCGGARLRSSRGPELARALRAALLETSGNTALPETISGHGSTGPSNAPHIAFVACPNVGHRYADGGILGCAIILPRHLDALDQGVLMRLLAVWERSRGEDGVVELGGDTIPSVKVERVGSSEKMALQPHRWCRPSRRFISATPIALDRHPGNLRSNQAHTAHKAALEAQRFVADACEHIGLPRPVEVEISLAPLLEGVQPVPDFLPWPPNPGRHPRARVHARIDFDRNVKGPILLGAGRYFGLGLFLPVV
jgi:CRISPR-associated protein Csb2